MCEKLLTTAEAAELLGVSRRFILSLVHRGALAAMRDGRLLRIRPHDVRKYIAVHLVDNRRHDMSWDDWARSH